MYWCFIKVISNFIKKIKASKEEVDTWEMDLATWVTVKCPVLM